MESSFDIWTMSEDTDASKLVPPTESMEDMFNRHDKEMVEYQTKARTAIKAAKKADKIAVEAQMLQGEYDLKARQTEESDRLEEQIGENFCIL